MLKQLARLILDPYPQRTVALGIIKKLNLGNYEWRVRIGAVERSHYAHCVYQSASLAKRLGYDRISVLEFGVAGGNGLVNLEYHAEQASRHLGIGIEVYGFDTGEGLPQPVDYKDLPYHWKAGFFRMDVGKLQARLQSAKLVLGDVSETAPSFFAEHNPPPIAAVMHDFDFYSSTAAALRMFDADEKYFLPRMYFYFDDTIGGELELYNDYTGQRLAINDFNRTHKDKKICAPYYLLCQKVVLPWYNKIFILHDFTHSKYNQFISGENQQLALNQRSH